MYAPINVYKGRTNVITINLGYDVSADELTSEIRTELDQFSTLIATWDVEFINDGIDGMLRLTLDDSVTSEIVYSKGYMDLKRVSAGEPLPVFSDPLPVVFKETITA